VDGNAPDDDEHDTSIEPRRLLPAMLQRVEPQMRVDHAPTIPISNPEARLVREVLARHQRELTELATEIAADRGIDLTRYQLMNRGAEGIRWELIVPPIPAVQGV
jgi:hypothetical protein